MTLLDGLSPPNLPSTMNNRRRTSRSTSISASNSGPSSYRASLGGKAIGNRYNNYNAASNNNSNPKSSGTSITSGGSGFTDSEFGENQIKFFGSATREELRDSKFYPIPF